MKKQTKGIIYKAVSPSGRAYVGQTITSLSQRRSQHKTSNNSSAIKSAIDKYGEAMVWSVIEEVVGADKQRVIDKLNELEVRYIEELDTLSPNGYNLHTGGNSHTPSEETRKRLSEANKGKKRSTEHRRKISDAQKGRVFSPKHREKISVSLTGKKHSNATRRKLSTIRKEKPTRYWLGKKRPPHSTSTKRKISQAVKGEKNGFYGKTHTAEVRKKISASAKRRVGRNNPKSKPVERSLDGKKWEKFHGQADAERETGTNQGHISSVCRSERPRAGGYKWRFSKRV